MNKLKIRRKAYILSLAKQISLNKAIKQVKKNDRYFAKRKKRY